MRAAPDDAPRVSSGPSVRALLAVADLPVAVAAAFALFLGITYLAVPRGGVMPQSLRRIVEVHEFLSSRASAVPERPFVVLGSSVTIEGIDCAILDASRPGAPPCRNLAWTGATPRQWLLISPALAAARPSGVVVALDLATLVDAETVSPQRLAIAGWWGFVGGAGAETLRASFTDRELALLDSPRALQLIRFRSFPLDALNERMREVARPELRYDGYTTNFVSPWVRRSRVSPSAVESSLRALREKLAAPTAPAAIDKSIEALRVVLGLTRDANPSTFIVLTPVHPDLLRGLPPTLLAGTRARLAALASESGAVFLDDSEFLPAKDFSDAVHPYLEGREAWSASLGRAIAATPR